MTQTGLYGVSPNRNAWPHKHSGSTVGASLKANARSRNTIMMTKKGARVADMILEIEVGGNGGM